MEGVTSASDAEECVTGRESRELMEDLVAKFGSRYSFLQDPYRALDRCIVASEEFASEVTSAGGAAEVVSGVRFGEMPEFPGHEVLLGGHYAVLVGDTVYDWTARQFDPQCDFPLVVPLSQWRSTWKAGFGG